MQPPLTIGGYQDVKQTKTNVLVKSMSVECLITLDELISLIKSSVAVLTYLQTLMGIPTEVCFAAPQMYSTPEEGADRSLHPSA